MKSLKRKPLRKHSKNKISVLKRKAWTVVSLFVRKRDADENGFVNCITCGVRKHYTQGDAGHFIPGRGNSILFDVRGIHFQCKPCNGGFKNQTFSKDEVAINYRKYMLKRYGEKVVKSLEDLRRQTKQFKEKELIEIRNRYL